MITRAISRSLAPTALAASLLVLSWAASGPHVSAQVTDFTVLAGWEDLDSGIEVQAFLPENIIIAEGDNVTWKFVPDEAHTVAFLGEQEQPELIVALPDGAVIFNPDAALPRGGVQHDGETLLNSGMLTYDPSAGDEPTYSVEFTTAGNYSYICLFHPNMAGTVTVLAERSALPFDQDTYDVIAVRERRTFIAELEALRDARGPLQLVEKPNGTIEHRLLAGLSTTKADFMTFFEDVVDISVGDTVTWSWGRSQAPHTVSFLEERANAPGLILPEPRDAKPLPPTLNPLVFNPSGGDTLPRRALSAPVSDSIRAWTQTRRARIR